MGPRTGHARGPPGRVGLRVRGGCPHAVPPQAARWPQPSRVGARPRRDHRGGVPQMGPRVQKRVRRGQ
eukprot:2770491-Lingulodinium_polyedra.AAC.1